LGAISDDSLAAEFREGRILSNDYDPFSVRQTATIPYGNLKTGSYDTSYGSVAVENNQLNPWSDHDPWSNSDPWTDMDQLDQPPVPTPSAKTAKDNKWLIAVIAAILVSAGALTTAFFPWGSAQHATSLAAPVRHRAGTPPDWPAVTAAVKDSVVAIWATESEGSGFILDSSGHIVTNAHVVGDETEFLVYLADGRLFEATKIYADALTDTAVIRLLSPPDNLQPVYLGDSATVQAGDPVLAIGNPRGLANTTTQGIVSAINRPSLTGDAISHSFINAIQIDAAINPGNSGGPLFNASGQVIGINYAGIGTSGSTGLNFAIPINLASRMASEIIAIGGVKHAFLGIEVIESRVIYNGQARLGAEIVDILPGSSASAIGLELGDIIVRLDNVEIDSPDALVSRLREKQVDDVIALTIVRNGISHHLNATLSPRALFEDDLSLSPFLGTWATSYAAYVPEVPSEYGFTADELAQWWDEERTGEVLFTLQRDGKVTNWNEEWNNRDDFAGTPLTWKWLDAEDDSYDGEFVIFDLQGHGERFPVRDNELLMVTGDFETFAFLVTLENQFGPIRRIG
jgi:S1-C subfamily serine protease